MEKQILFLTGLLGLAVSISAAPIRIVTSVPDLADFARQVAGPLAQVDSLANGVEDVHNVQLKPSMVTRLAKADVFIQMGMDLEHAYAPAVLEESRNPKIQLGQRGFIDTSKGVAAREVPRNIDRTEGEVHPCGNPHYNLDPEYAKLMVRTIAGSLSELYPEHQAAFQENTQKYLAQLDSKIREWKTRLCGKNIKFVSYHPAWVYFAERFGLQIIGTIEPKPGVEPGPRQIEELIALMKKEKVPLIVKESFYSDRIPNQIAAKTGARVINIPYMVGGLPQAENYVRMMDCIVDSFAKTP
ncbi:MAG: metal ABC transporter substrate-binding protein [Verrucomicrobiae bacterium]|nr:metal ABC transporter substrate-binding protein [Verrucomicrobiae bacterium]